MLVLRVDTPDRKQLPYMQCWWLSARIFLVCSQTKITTTALISLLSGTSGALISPFNHGQIFNKSTTEEETHCVQAARYQSGRHCSLVPTQTPDLAPDLHH